MGLTEHFFDTWTPITRIRARSLQIAAGSYNPKARAASTLLFVARESVNRQVSDLMLVTFRLPVDYGQSHVGPRDAGSPRGTPQRVLEPRLLVAEEDPPLGSHLVTPRRGFAHHGIYVGYGNVVHYDSAVWRFCRGQVEEVSLARFARGHAIWILVHPSPLFEGAEVARRARSRVGEKRYRLLGNNCEHFCEWGLQDEQRSYQVERMLSLLLCFARICASVRPTSLHRNERATCAQRRTASRFAASS